MHLVLNHVTELKHVADTHCRRLVETVTGTTIVEICLTETWNTRLVCPCAEVIKLGTVKDWSSELDTEFLTCTAEYGLENLTDVHT